MTCRVWLCLLLLPIVLSASESSIPPANSGSGSQQQSDTPVPDKSDGDSDEGVIWSVELSWRSVPLWACVAGALLLLIVVFCVLSRNRAVLGVVYVDEYGNQMETFPEVREPTAAERAASKKATDIGTSGACCSGSVPHTKLLSPPQNPFPRSDWWGQDVERIVATAMLRQIDGVGPDNLPPATTQDGTPIRDLSELISRIAHNLASVPVIVQGTWLSVTDATKEFFNERRICRRTKQPVPMMRERHLFAVRDVLVCFCFLCGEGHTVGDNVKKWWDYYTGHPQTCNLPTVELLELTLKSSSVCASVALPEKDGDEYIRVFVPNCVAFTLMAAITDQVFVEAALRVKHVLWFHWIGDMAETDWQVTVFDATLPVTQYDERTSTTVQVGSCPVLCVRHSAATVNSFGGGGGEKVPRFAVCWHADVFLKGSTTSGGLNRLEYCASAIHADSITLRNPATASPSAAVTPPPPPLTEAVDEQDEKERALRLLKDTNEYFEFQDKVTNITDALRMHFPSVVVDDRTLKRKDLKRPEPAKSSHLEDFDV